MVGREGHVLVLHFLPPALCEEQMLTAVLGKVLQGVVKVLLAAWSALPVAGRYRSGYGSGL